MVTSYSGIWPSLCASLLLTPGAIIRFPLMAGSFLTTLVCFVPVKWPGVVLGVSYRLATRFALHISTIFLHVDMVYLCYPPLGE